MALKMNVETAEGVTAEYWKIVEIKVNRLIGEVLFIVDVFKDKDASDASKRPFNMQQGFAMDCTKEELGGDLAALGYEYLKTQDFFADAKDA